MKNIDSAFRYVRGFSVLVICGCVIVTCFALYHSFKLVREGKDKVYVIAGDKAIEAFQRRRSDNLAVEARDHVRTFHELFFTLDPDEKVITRNIGRALYFADASAKRQYDNLKESGYYINIISGNISQTISVDSVQLDLARSPLYFRCYATQRIERTTSLLERRLVTEGFLRNVSRSDHNPHGFLIERWTTLVNQDIKTQNR